RRSDAVAGRPLPTGPGREAALRRRSRSSFPPAVRDHLRVPSARPRSDVRRGRAARAPGSRRSPPPRRASVRAMSERSDGQITDEGVARLRARIGIADPHPMPPHYIRPGLDAFRHVAVAYGDDNPLWCDPDYGAKSRWGSVIAPPVLVGGDTLVGEDE